MRTLPWTSLMTMAAFVSAALAQPAGEVRPDAAISELLSYSVPAEDWQEHLKRRQQAGWVPPPLPSAESPDKADIAQLAGHWRTDRPDERVSGEPDEVVRERLLAFCEKRPAMFEMLMGRFSSNQEGVLRRIQKLHDRLAASDVSDEETQAALPKVRLWLMTEAGLFREELMALAERYFTTPDNADLQAAFEALQKLEPKAATALLQRMIAEESPAERVTALLRLHALKDAPPGAWREELQKVVTTREIPAVVRARALKGLGEADWPGKVEWVMGLFDDPDLGLVQMDKYDKAEPLALLVKQSPDLWVPKIARLVGNPRCVVHDNAVRCLIQFKRSDALRPLLPWLSDPKWALDGEHEGRRRDLMYSLDDVELPESIPGLLWALEHDTEHDLMAATSALAHYHAAQAVPRLRKVIANEADLGRRKSLVKDLLELGGVSLEEQARAVEEYASIVLTKAGRDALQDEWMTPAFDASKSVVARNQRLLVTTGLLIVGGEAYQSEALAEMLAKRVDELRQQQKMDIAEALESRVSLWATRAGARLLAARLQAGRISGEWLWNVFSSHHVSLADMEDERELPSNVAAVVSVRLKDETRMRQILGSGSAEAQAMLLACARLRRTALPLDVVSSLLDSKHILCARAAERYLEAEDSAEARALLQRRFKGEARILGARMGHDPGHHSYQSLGGIEDMLREQVLAAKGPLEIHALLSGGYWGDVGQVWVEVEGGKATLVNDQGSGRYRTRPLTAAELAGLRSYMSQHRVDDLPPLTLPVDDGIQYEYVHLTAEGGRRVFMNNPGTYSGGLAGHGSMFVPAMEGGNEVDDAVYVGLVRLFQKLMEDPSGLKVTYRTATPVPGLKNVIPLEQKNIGAVMEHDGVLMVHDGRPGGVKGHWTAAAAGAGGGGKAEKIWDGPELTLANGGFPEGFSTLEHLVSSPWLSASSGGHVRPGTREKDDLSGLWLCREKQEPELIVKGTFASPITSLDGRWVVAARELGRSWAEPNDVVRINIATHEVFPLKLALADDFSTVTRLPHSGKILISRARDSVVPGIEPKEGPDKKEYHLLDPATGGLERVKGEFGPLEDETWRPLQPANEPSVVWASVSKFGNGAVEHVALGRYDLRTFSFTKVMDIPRWNLNSMDFWVDEKTRTVFLAKGDLLSFPLPNQEKKGPEKPPVKQ